MVTLPPSVAESLPPDVSSGPDCSMGDELLDGCEGSCMDADDLPEAVDDGDVKINGFGELSDISDDDLQLAQLQELFDTSAYTPTPDVAIHLRGRHDIAELYSPARCVPRAADFGVHGLLSLDIISGWDFRTPHLRALSAHLFLNLKVLVLILSPPCTIFSDLQRLWNFKRMTKEVAAAKRDEGMIYLRHSMDCAQQQYHHGRFFVFEHPASASSWKTPEVMKIASLPGVRCITIDQCMLGLRSKVSKTLVRKRTKLLTNSPYFVNRFAGCRCDRSHPHQILRGNEGGMRRSTYAQIYPPGLVDALCLGSRDIKQGM